MKTETTVLGTAAIVATARWTNDKNIDGKFVLGICVFALFLAAFTEANAPLAEKVGTLVFVTALLIYGPQVATGLGLIKKSGSVIGGAIPNWGVAK